ncbi:uncharacterized protein MELLADRAFT_89068 [Melampsora larici-populina 98AG31]|uniref:Uncharacterized protein n=1 Tax=Melampsora larici-populina (strain 98AG31 / pathotype 3-4-7) TaxID=747676 RepID=F4R6V9_MELLP|nr:uncharacterized protein MELLADRAFT_89068 [Melampsora larici-populina 98AG31]EGG11941.1 hypothetical protein MELLADRAFT_89068 [Melampsora larici-populina 98AG31]
MTREVHCDVHKTTINVTINDLPKFFDACHTFNRRIEELPEIRSPGQTTERQSHQASSMRMIYHKRQRSFCRCDMMYLQRVRTSATFEGFICSKNRRPFIFVLGQVINPVKCILRIIELLVANYYQMLPSPSGVVGEFLSP